jgi:hypothetical protein
MPAHPDFLIGLYVKWFDTIFFCFTKFQYLHCLTIYLSVGLLSVNAVSTATTTNTTDITTIPAVIDGGGDDGYDTFCLFIFFFNFNI